MKKQVQFKDIIVIVFAILAAGFGALRVEAGAFASITLQPVEPPVPGVSYPPGTTIVGQEIILGSVPARVWLEVLITGWAPDNIKTVQVAISATDPEMDGGGYSGSSADCMGSPPLGGNLHVATQPCNTDADCRQLAGPSCILGLHSMCATWDGVNPPYFPAGKFCTPGYQNKCNPRWAAKDTDGVLNCLSAVDSTTLNFRYVLACAPDVFAVDYHPSYVGTLVLDVPADAKGSYTIDFDQSQSFLQNDGPPGANNIPPIRIVASKVTVPCGRCCYELGSANPQCVDHVSANECAGYGAGAVFAMNEVCPQDGGPACPACALDEHCDDGTFCNGVEVCEANGKCGPGQSLCESWEGCEESTASCAPRIPAMSSWGLVVLTLTFLIAAKVRRAIV